MRASIIHIFDKIRFNVKSKFDKGDIEGLIKCLKYKQNPSIQLHAAKALGLLCATSAVESLIEVLKQHPSSSFLNQEVIIALGNIQDERAIDPLIGELKKKNHKFKYYQLAVALAKIGNPVVLKPLFEILWQRHPTYFFKTIDIFVKKGWRPCPEDDQLFSIIYLIINRQWMKLESYGISALKPLIFVLRDPQYKKDYNAICKVMIKFGPLAIDCLCEHLEKESSFQVLNCLMFTLGEINDKKSTGSLIKALAYNFSYADIVCNLSHNAERALLRLGPQAKKELFYAYDHPEEYITSKAIDAIRGQHPHSSQSLRAQYVKNMIKRKVEKILTSISTKDFPRDQ